MIGKPSAKQIVRYYYIYRGYCMSNNLYDDTNETTIDDVVDFVQEQIDTDDYEHYEAYGKLLNN